MSLAGPGAEWRYWFVKGAEAGYANLQYDLGNNYFSGSEGFPRDWNKARFWLQKAATSGYPQAQLTLAVDYSSPGALYPRDRVKARAWLTRAARMLSRARIELSIYYRRGVAGPADGKKAESLVAAGLAGELAFRRKVGKPALAPSEIPYRLARHFICPYAAPVDLGTGRRFLEQAARRGNSRAKGALAQNFTDPEVRARLCRDWPSLTDK